MPIYNKPLFNSVWAANGEKTAPTDAKINQGWVVEIPPHQYENWISNRQDQMLAHINQYGIVEWDSSTEYQANKSYAQGVTTGNVYRALTTNTGINPETDANNNWTIAFERSGLSLLKSQNLADVPDKAAARTNLGIATTADYDARYLLKSSNFADVPNKASARSNLGLGTAAVTNIGTTAGTSAAGDDSRIVNAVQTSRRITAGVGLTGGGVLSADISVGMGTPSHVSATSQNTATGSTHTHAVDIESLREALLPTRYYNMTSTRTSGVTYTNSLGKYIEVYVSLASWPHNSSISAYVDGIRIAIASGDWDSGGGYGHISFTVPAKSTYSVVVSGPSIAIWMELR